MPLSSRPHPLITAVSMAVVALLTLGLALFVELRVGSAQAMASQEGGRWQFAYPQGWVPIVQPMADNSADAETLVRVREPVDVREFVDELGSVRRMISQGRILSIYVSAAGPDERLFDHLAEHELIPVSDAIEVPEVMAAVVAGAVGKAGLMIVPSDRLADPGSLAFAAAVMPAGHPAEGYAVTVTIEGSSLEGAENLALAKRVAKSIAYRRQ